MSCVPLPFNGGCGETLLISLPYTTQAFVLAPLKKHVVTWAWIILLRQSTKTEQPPRLVFKKHSLSSAIYTSTLFKGPVSSLFVHCRSFSFSVDTTRRGYRTTNTDRRCVCGGLGAPCTCEEEEGRGTLHVKNSIACTVKIDYCLNTKYMVLNLAQIKTASLRDVLPAIGMCAGGSPYPPRRNPWAVASCMIVPTRAQRCTRRCTQRTRCMRCTREHTPKSTAM